MTDWPENRVDRLTREIERDEIADFIERTFGRMFLMNARGYIEGRDLAKLLRDGLDLRAPFPPSKGAA